jgi:hypothetical protein
LRARERAASLTPSYTTEWDTTPSSSSDHTLRLAGARAALALALRNKGSDRSPPTAIKARRDYISPTGSKIAWGLVGVVEIKHDEPQVILRRRRQGSHTLFCRFLLDPLQGNSALCRNVVVEAGLE